MRRFLIPGLVGIASLVVGFGGVSALFLGTQSITAELTANLYDQAREEDARNTRTAILALPSDERAIADASRRVIVDAGLSSAYADAHVFFDRVLRDGEEWIVQWRFSDGDRIVPLIDRITAGSGATLIHSLASQLGRAHDLTNVIPAAQATTALRACIGEFAQPIVRFAATIVDGPASLTLSARSIDGTSMGTLDLETGECRKGMKNAE